MNTFHSFPLRTSYFICLRHFPYFALNAKPQLLAIVRKCFSIQLWARVTVSTLTAPGGQGSGCWGYFISLAARPFWWSLNRNCTGEIEILKLKCETGSLCNGDFSGWLWALVGRDTKAKFWETMSHLKPPMGYTCSYCRLRIIAQFIWADCLQSCSCSAIFQTNH